MKYKIHRQCVTNIKRFYRNVAKKYRNTYSKELMRKNVIEAIRSMYQIEAGLLRRKPTLSRWEGCYMANTQKWYYAYKILNDTIVVVDACHAQNMTDIAEMDLKKP